MLDELKTEIAFDKYVLFLLGLGFSKDKVAELCQISRPGVYLIIRRNKKRLEEWGIKA